MNRYKLQYIFETIRTRDDFPGCLIDTADMIDVLRLTGFHDLLAADERGEVVRELREWAKGESFKEAHQRSSPD